MIGFVRDSLCPGPSRAARLTTALRAPYLGKRNEDKADVVFAVGKIKIKGYDLDRTGRSKELGFRGYLQGGMMS